MASRAGAKLTKRLVKSGYTKGVSGARVYDIREPNNPMEVAFYVPFANANTDPDGYMTNNIEIDDRGYIYIVDRNGAATHNHPSFPSVRASGDVLRCSR